MPHNKLLCAGAVCYAEVPDGTKIAVHQRNSGAVLRVVPLNAGELPPKNFNDVPTAFAEFVNQLQCRI